MRLTHKFNLRCKLSEKQPLQDIEVFCVKEDWGIRIQANTCGTEDTILQLWNNGEVYIDEKGKALFGLRIGYLDTK